MDPVTRNVLRHVYEALQDRKRMADSGNVSNLQLFYNRLISEYCATEKKGQCLVVPLTGQDVDDFYTRKMTREMFVEVVRTKVIAKLNHFDPSALHKLCWECFCTSHDPQLIRVITMVGQQSATLLWLLFCKLDTEGKLKLHPEDVMELIIRLLIHLRATPDRKMVEMWLGEQCGSLAAWMSFWPFLIVIVEKCLAPRGAQATSRAVQSLYEEIVDEVMKKGQMTKKGHLRHTWKMRWFVLTTTDLFYYESKESLVKKGSVVLNARAIVDVMQDKNEKDTRYPNRFKVVDGISSQITEISAENLTQMNEWVEAIRMAIQLNSIEGRNYIHRLQLVQKSSNIDNSRAKSPVMQTFSVQPSSLPSMDTVSDLVSEGSGGGGNKISRKISLPVMGTSPPVVESREAVSANSSQTDLYAMVDKKKKSSVPFIPGSSTRPVRRHDYEDIDDELPPKPPPYQHSDSRPNGNIPPRVPAPYQGGNKEMKSPRKIGDLHSNSVDMMLSNTRGDDAVIRRLKPSQSTENPKKRHSSIINENDFNRTYSSISDEDIMPADIRRSHTPEVGLFASNSRPPELPTHRKQSPPTVVPRRGSPVTSRRQLPVDTSTPPKLPPKNNQQVYSEVPQTLTTTFAISNGAGGGIIISESKDSSYADLDWSEGPPSGDTSAIPVDHSKRDYADIDFAVTQQLEKSILKEDSATTSHVVLQPKKGIKGGGANKNMGSSEDKSGYVTVDYPAKSNGTAEGRSGQPRQMMVVQPQQSGRMSPMPIKAVSSDTPPSRPIPTRRSQPGPPSIPPHHSKNPPPLPPKQTPH